MGISVAELRSAGGRVKQIGTKAKEAARFVTAMANARRLLIMHLVLDRELPAEALREQLGLSSSALSQHMAKLRALGLVRVRRDRDNIVHYSCCNDSARKLLALLDHAYGSGPSKQNADLGIPD
ncbi:winged helix-turn-helix transcriptional regulator [Mesorhizobium sp. B2-3-15]|nr:winged helix-turn-helix transcriptional regulator [Mesorhizobium sp. B2-3-15]TPL99669.1 winged helix-turn-helix transcriptional regulator [Mesorhizobium sp. B2-3-10]